MNGVVLLAFALGVLTVKGDEPKPLTAHEKEFSDNLVVCAIVEKDVHGTIRVERNLTGTLPETNAVMEAVLFDPKSLKQGSYLVFRLERRTHERVSSRSGILSIQEGVVVARTLTSSKADGVRVKVLEARMNGAGPCK